ncbi:MAG: THUMP domain-containing protein [Candidatus Bathyarchaeia archaeon]
MWPGVGSMLQDFNLLLSTSRGNEGNARSEIWYLLKEVGDEDPKADFTGISGLLTAKTGLEPKEAVRRLRGILVDRPWEFKYILKIKPIELVVKTDLDEMIRAIDGLKGSIGNGEKFKIAVEKRRSPLGSREIIDALASRIDRKVDLENPDWIVLVEVIGTITGLSILRPDEILSVEKEKREMYKR